KKRRSGGGGPPPPPRTCTPEWECADWTACLGGERSQTCKDKNKCDPDNFVTVTTEACINPCENGIQDPGEEGIDCGGSCAACGITKGSVRIGAPANIPVEIATPATVTIELENLAKTDLQDMTVVIPETGLKESLGALPAGKTRKVEVTIDPLKTPQLVKQLKTQAAPQITFLVMEGDSTIAERAATLELSVPEGFATQLRVCDEDLAEHYACEPGEPLLFMIVDNRGAESDKKNVQFVYNLEKDGKEIFSSVFGPFNVEDDEILIQSEELSTLSLPPEVYQASVSMYERGVKKAEATQTVDLREKEIKTKGLSAGFLIFLLIIAVVIVVLYFAVDMFMERGGK
ncbi:hypothetical protein D6783_03795, partial [Candidatus Woesearchaeota archaeon]